MSNDIQISLQGVHREVKIDFSQSPLVVGRRLLQITWFDNSYKDYIITFKKWSNCQKFNKDCLYVTTKDTNHHFKTYVFAGKLLIYTNNHTFQNQHGNKTSWEEASGMCTKLGGNLPHFTNGQDLNEFITVLLKSQNIPFIEAVYIGLTHEPGQVS